jgi:hypothetical protein
MDSDDDFYESGDKKSKGKENKFPAVTGEVPAKFLETSRGGKCLVDPFNYTYNFNRDYKGKTFWRCCRDRSTLFPRYF